MRRRQWMMFGGVLLAWWAAVVSSPLCFVQVDTVSVRTPMTPAAPLWLELSGLPGVGAAPRGPRIVGGGEDGDGPVAVGDDVRGWAEAGAVVVAGVVDPVLAAARRGMRARGPPIG